MKKFLVICLLLAIAFTAVESKRRRRRSRRRGDDAVCGAQKVIEVGKDSTCEKDGGEELTKKIEEEEVTKCCEKAQEKEGDGSSGRKRKSALAKRKRRGDKTKIADCTADEAKLEDEGELAENEECSTAANTKIIKTADSKCCAAASKRRRRRRRAYRLK